MPTVDLTEADVESYTKGRLSATDPETTRALNAALTTVRRYCGWHVTPVIDETMLVSGPGDLDLILPTLYIQSITSITDNDTAIDLTTVDWDNAEPGVLHKNDWKQWSCGLGKIVVELSHGFDDAYDFQQGVLEFIDRSTAQVGTVIGNTGPMSSKKVDDVTYQWGHSPSSPGQNPGAALRMFDGLNHTLLDRYRILPFA